MGQQQPRVARLIFHPAARNRGTAAASAALRSPLHLRQFHRLVMGDQRVDHLVEVAPTICGRA